MTRRDFLKVSGATLSRFFLPLTDWQGNNFNLLVMTYHGGVTSSFLINDYRFCRQQGWQQVGIESLGNFFTKGETLPRYCFASTFDDGLVDQKQAILGASDYIKTQWDERYQATLFAITQYEHKTDSTDSVETLPLETLTFREDDREGKDYPVRHMNLGDLLELLERGEGFIRVEDHTVDHANLVSPLLDADSRIAQIADSKRRTDLLYKRAGLERIYNALAYPYWQHNEIVRKEVEQAGFTMAFGAMLNSSLQKTFRPAEQTPAMRFYLQRMSRT